MKGFVGFLTGAIGLCFFAAFSIIGPLTIRRDGEVLFVVMLGIAYIFLNIMVVGFYRLLGQLHETALYPEDAYHYPQRGRVLFLVGYIGLTATIGFAAFVIVYGAMARIIRPRDFEWLLLLAWFAGWVFFGLVLGGVLSMLRDVHQKLFISQAAASRRGFDDEDDGLDISLSRRRRERRNLHDDDRTRRERYDDDAEPRERRSPAKPWDGA